MEQKRFATQNFYMEAVVDDDRIVSLVGCSAKVEMVELNHLQITTAKSQMYFELDTEIKWLADENYTIPAMRELLDDYDMYRHNTGDFSNYYITPPSLYLDEYEECVNDLPVPFKEYFLALHNEFGISPATFQCKTQIQTHLLRRILMAGVLEYQDTLEAECFRNDHNIPPEEYKELIQQVENFIDHLSHRCTYKNLPVK